MPAKYIHPIIRQIIDRDCHVGECNRMVVRHVIAQLKDGNETFRRMPMAERRKFVEQCLAQHAANRRLFSEVMTGFPATRKREQELAKQIQSVSGKELVSLMNEHGKSSEFMAFRLGTTLHKVQAGENLRFDGRGVDRSMDTRPCNRRFGEYPTKVSHTGSRTITLLRILRYSLCAE